MLVQTSIWGGSDVGWINLNDTQDQLNTRMDLHKVEKAVQAQVTAIGDTVKRANDAVDQANKAIDSSNVNKAAIDAANSAVAEAKQSASDAVQKLQSVESSVNTTSDEVTKAKQSQADQIKQVTNQISDAVAQAKAATDSLDAKTDALQTAVKNAQSDATVATQTASEANLTAINAASDAATAKITASGAAVTAINAQSDVVAIQATASEATITAGNAASDALTAKVTASSANLTATNASSDVARVSAAADSLSTRVTTVEGKTAANSTAIDENAKAITLKADQTSVGALNKTVTDNSAAVSVLNDEIKLKVDSTTVNEMIDGKGFATTNTVQSLITQKAGTINESITNLDAKYKAKDGVNLATGTGNVNASGGYGTNGNIGGISLDTINDLRGKHITISVDVEWKGWKSGNQNRIGYELQINYDDGSVEYDGSWLTPTTTDGKQRITATYKLKDQHIKSLSEGYAYVQINCSSAKISHLKIERGTVATPWTPAPIDNATVTQVQQITASIDGLQSTVANKADKSQITQLSNVIQSKVSTSDFTSKVSQLSNDINLRVTKGDLISQINLEAGGDGLISIQNGKGKLMLDADSVVFGNKAFIPSAAITNIQADQITTGTLDAAKLYVKNFSADNISGGTLSGITVKTGDKNRYFQTSKDSIYWVRDNKTSLIGTDQYINPSDGLVIADTHSVTLTTWYGATVKDDGTITNGSGNIGYPKLILDSDGKWEPDASGGSCWEGNTGKAQIGQWIADKEYTNLAQGKGFIVHLDDQNKDSIFTIQKDNCVGAYFGRGEHGNHIDFVTAGDDQAVNITGNFHVTGSKNSIVETKQGYLAINAYETAEYYFGDIGESNTGDTSQITIGIDRIFNETVNTDIQYQVFVTPYSDAHVWVEKRYNNRFVVKSDKPGAEFGWELKAKRKGYESNRLRRVNVDFDQANIKGEN